MPSVRSLVITGPGGPEVLQIQERALPEPADGELLVEVHAAGLNRADLLQRAGHYPAPAGVPADVPGLEFAGRVLRRGAGSEAARWSAGDAVMGLVGGGAMSTHVLLSAAEALPAPPELPLEHAAALPEAFLTAYDALVRRAALRPGELALLHAVGSGVGTAAVQLVRAWGARSVGTSRTPSKLARCAALGLDHAAHTPDPDALVHAVLAATDGEHPALVLDTVGAAYLPANLELLAERGRLVQLGLLAGRRARLDLGVLLTKRLSVYGSVLRSRPTHERRALIDDARRELLPRFADGSLRPVIDDVLPMSAAADAHRRLAANDSFGKLLLDPRS